MARVKSEPVFIPMVRVHPDMITIYSSVMWPNGRPQRKIKDNSAIAAFDYTKKPTYSGTICSHSRKRLRKALNLLVAQAEWKTALMFKSNREFQFKVNFVTLTLPAAQGDVSDRYLKSKCLDPWIKTMKRRHGLRSYVWRAERQFNGNLHFHVTTDTYLPFDSLRDVWNHQLSKCRIMHDHISKHGHAHPNSTDVHSVQAIKNIAAYMVKYMSKTSKEHLRDVNKKRALLGKSPIDPSKHPFRKVPHQPEWDSPIDGKVWDCSQNLKRKDSCTSVIDNSIDRDLCMIADSVPDQCLSSEYCFMIYFRGAPPESFIQGELLQLWNDYLFRIRSVSETKQEPIRNATTTFPQLNNDISGHHLRHVDHQLMLYQN